MRSLRVIMPLTLHWSKGEITKDDTQSVIVGGRQVDYLQTVEGVNLGSTNSNPSSGKEEDKS